VLPLAEEILRSLGAELGRRDVVLGAKARARLERYAFPGNVRELRNVLERAVMLNESPRLGAGHLASVLPALPARAPAADTAHAPEPRSLSCAVAEAERRAIHEALASCGGNKVSAAQVLGISRGALYEKMAALGIAATRPR